MSKKKLFCVILFILFLSHIVFINLYQANPTAEYIYDENDDIVSVKLKDEIYVPLGSDVPEPYYYIYNGNWFELKSYFVPYNDISDFLFMWDTAHFYSEHHDKDKNFMRCNIWGRTSDDLYVKEGFVFPSIKNNVVNEVWMSRSDSYEIINDKKTVDKIVECTKSDGELELDKEIVDYIKKYSADNHCFYLKYEGYPLVEEFHIEVTEDSRYIVEQYPIENYETSFREDKAHQ